MLGGLDPILIFNFKKLIPSILEPIAQIPVVAGGEPSTFPLPIIPLYLSEKLTGLYIDSESKSLEIQTQTDTTSNGKLRVHQRGIQNTVKIEMVASRGSIGIALLGALSDLVFPLVTSKEYSITYLHGATVILGGLLHSFNIDQNANDTRYRISLELQRPASGEIRKIVDVNPVAGATLNFPGAQ